MLRDTSLVAIGQALFKGTLYLGSILLSRMLSVEQFAIFGYFLVTSGFLAMFFSAGLTIAATKTFAEASAGRGEDGGAAAVVLILIGAALAALALSPVYLPIVSDQSIRLGGLWLVAAGIAQAAYLVAAAAMYGANAFRFLLMPLLIGSAILLLGMLFAGLERDLLPALLAICLAHFVPTLMYAGRLWRLGLLRFARPSRAAVGSVAATAGPTLGIALITSGVVWLITRSLLEHAVSTAQFNMFVIGMQWFVLALFIPNALGNALFPRFLHGAAAGGLPMRKVLGVSLAVFAIIAAAAGVAALLTPLISALYGPHYEFSRAFVFTILLGAAIAGTVSMLSYPVMAALGVRSWLLANLALLAGCVALLVAWPPTDALEAALVICGSYAVVLVAALLLVPRIARAGRVAGARPRAGG